MIQTEVLKTVAEYRMFDNGDKVVVGVSGGPDSVCLVYMLKGLKQYGLDLIVCHFNHGLRKKESERDEKFVRKLAEKLGLKFETGRADTRQYKIQEKISVEDAARQLRYKFFRETLAKHSADKIATAHTLDDQAETVLMRLLRGSGTKGLSGIPPVNDDIVRPLINISKKEITKYLRSKKIKWVEDSSNRSKKHLRNRIRIDLIPELQKYNPAVVEVLSRTSNLLRIDSEFLNIEVDSVFARVFSKKSFGYIGKINRYLKFHKSIRLRLLRRCVEKLKGDLKSLSNVQILSMDNQINSPRASSEILLPGSMIFSKGYDLFCISKIDSLGKSYHYEIPGYGEYRFPGGLKMLVEKSSDKSDLADEDIGHFSLKSVLFPIVVRNIRPGDRFKPLGVNGYKKIKDFYIDQKVPRFLRKSVPLFECAEGIMWIGGLRIDQRFRVKSRERNFLKITLKKPELKLIKKF